MPSRYSVAGAQVTAPGATKTILAVRGGTTVRTRVYWIVAGAGNSTPADVQLNLALKRFTAVGTSTSVTPEPIEVGDVAALTVAGQDHIAEPTYAGVNLLDIPVHQRSTFQFYAEEGGEFITALTANTGFGLQTISISSGIPVIRSTMHFKE